MTTGTPTARIYAGRRDRHSVVVAYRDPGSTEWHKLTSRVPHSPFGLDWGNEDTAVELARCLLIDALGDLATCADCHPLDDTASTHCPVCHGTGLSPLTRANRHQQVKNQLVATFAHDEWTTTRQSVIDAAGLTDLTPPGGQQ